MHLVRGAVVAVCKGRSEFGPRALGHRSLLASAGRRSMTERLNRIEGSGVVQARGAGRLRGGLWPFLRRPGGEHAVHDVSARVLDVARSSIPAACHVDGTARVQTVSKRDEPFVHALLRAHERETGVPVLINTSFNFGGNPSWRRPKRQSRAFSGLREWSACSWGTIVWRSAHRDGAIDQGRARQRTHVLRIAPRHGTASRLPRQ